MPKQHAVFASNLAKHMQQRRLNHSDLAGKVWGRTKDGRGYEVARNRDRIGHYLTGTSMPTPENLKKITAALGCTIEDLVGPGGLPVSVSRRPATPTGLRLSQAEQPGMARIQIDGVLPWAVALEIGTLWDKGSENRR